jgi:hypothetical protein
VLLVAAKGKGKYRDVTEAHSPYEHVRVRPSNPARPQRGQKRQALAYPRPGGPRAFAKPIRGRRRYEPYAVEDPQEARAVSPTTYDGTILERIVYKRSLILFGPPGYFTWSAQHEEQGGRNLIGGIAIDFVYWLSRPFLALEVQGTYWHGPFAQYTDATRALILRGYGYRYAELGEDEVLALGDDYLDRRLLDLVGGRVSLYEEQWLTHPRTFTDVVHTLNPLRERRPP